MRKSIYLLPYTFILLSTLVYVSHAQIASVATSSTTNGRLPTAIVNRAALDHFAFLPLITSPAGTTLHPFEQQVIELTNAERARVGCGALTANDKLVAAARSHSQDMADNDFFDHEGSDGSSPGERLDALGYNWRTYGENIAAGYPNAASVVEDWMNSSGHRANILNCDFAEIGVGYVFHTNDSGTTNYIHYWTQLFGRQ